LSAMAIPGIRETYAGTSWTATQWLSLNGDVRRSRNDWAVQGLAQTSNMATVAASAYIPKLPSVSFTLQTSQARGENPGGSRNDSASSSAGARYTATRWQTGLTASRSRMDNDDFAGFNASIDGLGYDVGFMLGDAVAATPGLWSANLNFGVGVQDQKFDSGVDTKGYSFNAGATFQHARWGSIYAAYTYNITEQPSGMDLETHGAQVEASRPVFAKGLIKFYLRTNRRNDDAGILDYREETAGAQLVLAY
jgi:hypothetical protein